MVQKNFSGVFPQWASVPQNTERRAICLLMLEWAPFVAKGIYVRVTAKSIVQEKNAQKDNSLTKNTTSIVIYKVNMSRNFSFR